MKLDAYVDSFEMGVVCLSFLHRRVPSAFPWYTHVLVKCVVKCGYDNHDRFLFSGQKNDIAENCIQNGEPVKKG